MKRFAKYILPVVMVITVAAFAASGKTRPDSEAMPETYSIKTFLEPDWELAMHEVFTHYLQAAANFGQGDYETAIAFLQVMEYYVTLLPDRIPEEAPDGSKIDRGKFIKEIGVLRSNTSNLRKMIEKKEYAKATKVAPDYVTSLCTECHKKAKVPPRWQIGGYKIDE